LLEVAGGCRRRKSETEGGHLTRHLTSCNMSCDKCLCNVLSAERQGSTVYGGDNDATALFQQGIRSLQTLLLCPLGFLERQACAVEAGQLWNALYPVGLPYLYARAANLYARSQGLSIPALMSPWGCGILIHRPVCTAPTIPDSSSPSNRIMHPSTLLGFLLFSTVWASKTHQVSAYAAFSSLLTITDRVIRW
jgi:hypothetical protein